MRRKIIAPLLAALAIGGAFAGTASAAEQTWQQQYNRTNGDNSIYCRNLSPSYSRCPNGKFSYVASETIAYWSGIGYERNFYYTWKGSSSRTTCVSGIRIKNATILARAFQCYG